MRHLGERISKSASEIARIYGAFTQCADEIERGTRNEILQVETDNQYQAEPIPKLSWTTLKPLLIFM